MSFLARLVSDNSGSLEKLELGHRPPQTPLRKRFLHGDRVLVRGYLRVRFDLRSSINFSDISGSPNGEPIPLIMGHLRESRVVLLESTNMISC